jgi:hypothetical protein
MSWLDGDVGVAKSAGPGSRGMVFGVVLEGWKDYTGTGSVGGQCVYDFCRSPVQCTAMCVCVPVSEAGGGEQWPEGDAVTRGEVVSARVLHSSTT